MGKVSKEDFAKVFRDSFGIDCEAGDLFGTRKVRKTRWLKQPMT